MANLISINDKTQMRKKTTEHFTLTLFSRAGIWTSAAVSSVYTVCDEFIASSTIAPMRRTKICVLCH